ncbi:hypothetical protein VSP20_07140 [Myroides phaeus]|uniref:hypothetical protein n=1 Tax=Myroides phaeus TaxID=702745 RepID=UPI002DB6A48C|nr:hypothetical protein [Myroides phaeus]MEC4116742.1 hypothetical protein [Myroides phaeus]
MRTVFKIGLLLSCFTTWSQVGIGTHDPHKSAVIEITAKDKGILLPMHRFEEFDNDEIPIHKPRVGTLVYNTIGGAHNDLLARKGIYVWDGKKWNQLLNVEGTDKLLTVRMGRSTGAQDLELIKDGSESYYGGLEGYNFINFKNNKYVVSSTFIEDLKVKGSHIEVPKGFYRVEVSLDGYNKNYIAENHNSFLPGYLGLFVKECIIIDDQGNKLAEPKTLSVVSSQLEGASIQGYSFTFFIRLKDRTSIRIGLRNGQGTSNKMGFLINQNGVSVKLRRYFD